MNKKFVETVLGFYSWIRMLLEARIFKAFSQKKIEYREDKWEESKNLNIFEFDKLINEYPYKSDKWGGLLDMSFPVDKPGYFFSDLDWGRDCDDYARIWALYLKLHGWEEVTEVIVLDSKKPFSTAHVVTVAKLNGRYSLFNYEKYGNFNTFENAINYMTAWKSYPSETFVWKKYKEY